MPDTVDKVAGYLGLTPAMLLCPGMVCLLSDVDPEKYPKPLIKEQRIKEPKSKKEKINKEKAKKEKTSKKRKQSKNTESVEGTVLPAEEYIDNIDTQWMSEGVELAAPFEDTTEDIYEELYSSDDAEWLENNANSEEYTDNTEE